MACKKWSKIFLFACLILALIGTSAISAGEAFSSDCTDNDNPGSDRYFSSIEDRTVDWLASGRTAREARSYSNSPPRNRLLRVFTLATGISIALYPAESNLIIIENNNIPTIKPLVLLKLRI